MRIYRITVIADKYPTEYNVNASNWGTAVARAIREWQKKFKGSRANELHIRAFKSSAILTANDEKHEI